MTNHDEDRTSCWPSCIQWHNPCVFGNLTSEPSGTLPGQCPQTLKTLSMDLLLHFSMYKGNAGRSSFTAKDSDSGTRAVAVAWLHSWPLHQSGTVSRKDCADPPGRHDDGEGGMKGPM